MTFSIQQKGRSSYPVIIVASRVTFIDTDYDGYTQIHLDDGSVIRCEYPETHHGVAEKLQTALKEKSDA